MLNGAFVTFDSCNHLRRQSRADARIVPIDRDPTASWSINR
jgi:hypothetical protein